jgi:hypothetical protein
MFSARSRTPACGSQRIPKRRTGDSAAPESRRRCTRRARAESAGMPAHGGRLCVPRSESPRCTPPPSQCTLLRRSGGEGVPGEPRQTSVHPLDALEDRFSSIRHRTSGLGTLQAAGPGFAARCGPHGRASLTPVPCATNSDGTGTWSWGGAEHGRALRRPSRGRDGRPLSWAVFRSTASPWS